MSPTDLRLLLDFHYWARDRVLDAVEALAADEFTAPRGSSFASIRDTLAHTLFAERAWYARWQGHSPTRPPDFTEFPDVASLRATWTEVERQVRAFVDPLDDEGVRRVIDYRLLNGTPGSSAIWQMVQHVVNHATYHRGQVTTMLRQAGAAPARSTDLIVFYRERGGVERIRDGR